MDKKRIPARFKPSELGLDVSDTDDEDENVTDQPMHGTRGAASAEEEVYTRKKKPKELRREKALAKRARRKVRFATPVVSRYIPNRVFEPDTTGEIRSNLHDDEAPERAKKPPGEREGHRARTNKKPNTARKQRTNLANTDVDNDKN